MIRYGILRRSNLERWYSAKGRKASEVIVRRSIATCNGVNPVSPLLIRRKEVPQITPRKMSITQEVHRFD